MSRCTFLARCSAESPRASCPKADRSRASCRCPQPAGRADPVGHRGRLRLAPRSPMSTVERSAEVTALPAAREALGSSTSSASSTCRM